MVSMADSGAVIAVQSCMPATCGVTLPWKDHWHTPSSHASHRLSCTFHELLGGEASQLLNITSGLNTKLSNQDQLSEPAKPAHTAHPSPASKEERKRYNGEQRPMKLPATVILMNLSDASWLPMFGPQHLDAIHPVKPCNMMSCRISLSLTPAQTCHVQRAGTWQQHDQPTNHPHTALLHALAHAVRPASPSLHVRRTFRDLSVPSHFGPGLFNASNTSMIFDDLTRSVKFNCVFQHLGLGDMG